jgi:hypothetical protein
MHRASLAAEAGLLTYVTLREGEDTGGISAALLGASSRSAVSYGWGSKTDGQSTNHSKVEGTSSEGHDSEAVRRANDVRPTVLRPER